MAVTTSLHIIKEGSVKKFVNKIEQVTFSADYAVEKGTPVTYITERCIFRLKEDGLHLTEVAPGIDIEKDILAHMDFKPINPRGYKGNGSQDIWTGQNGS